MATSREYSSGIAVQDDHSDEQGEYSRSTLTVLLERAVILISGGVVLLLMARFILSLLGTNRSGAFASFIYSASHPLVAPFFTLFNYRLEYGQSRFEVETLIALAVYAIIAALILTLLAIPSEGQEN